MRNATVALLVGIIGVAAATATTYSQQRTCSAPDLTPSQDGTEDPDPTLFQKAIWRVKH